MSISKLHYMSLDGLSNDGWFWTEFLYNYLLLFKIKICIYDFNKWTSKYKFSLILLLLLTRWNFNSISSKKTRIILFVLDPNRNTSLSFSLERTYLLTFWSNLNDWLFFHYRKIFVLHFISRSFKQNKIRFSFLNCIYETSHTLKQQ